MSGFEWFLVIVVVILVPLAIAVGVTLWTLEMARQRNRRNRPDAKPTGVARKAIRQTEGALANPVTADSSGVDRDRGNRTSRDDPAGRQDSNSDDGGSFGDVRT
ncbi:MAG: hypothetical protein M3451_09035 [Chloroflexota bacterium]|jgi:hypothetical protein|nr:hypothetical protein [Chloroflexota bacterium]